ncbi:MAG: acyltransferase family protein [Fimbriimonadaceae bacterium]
MKARIPYLDGLRGYSILCVVVSHAGPSLPWPIHPVILVLFANADLGVRTFFVISGYLITALLLKERAAVARIDIGGFYRRRVARIFPVFYAYVAVIVILTVAGEALIGWPRFLAAATFTWNYGAVWWPPGTGSVYDALLGHFWTLSLEEQFYLLMPVSLLVLGPGRLRGVVAVLLVIMPVVRLVSYFATPTLRGQLGMMLHTGIDQIAWGCGLALVFEGPSRLKAYLARAGAWFPALLAAAVFVVAPVLAARVRGAGILFRPTIECASVALFLAWLLAAPRPSLGRVLDFRPLVWLGLISYGLYIWQQVFLMFPGERPWIPFPLNILAALVTAIISYFAIEQPLRRVIRGSPRRPAPDSTA